MNLAELREGVYDRVGVDTDDGLVTADVVNRAVNAALRQISADRDWPWLQTSRTFTTVDGTGSYAPADGWMRTRELRIDGDNPLTLFDKLELDARYPSSTTTGRPDSYAVEGDLILLRAIPDGAYDVVDNYLQAEPGLYNDSDLPLMPEVFHDAIVEKASSIIFRRTANSELAVQAEAAYQEWRNQALGDDTTRADRTKRVIIRPGAFF